MQKSLDCCSTQVSRKLKMVIYEISIDSYLNVSHLKSLSFIQQQRNCQKWPIHIYFFWFSTGNETFADPAINAIDSDNTTIIEGKLSN